MNKSTEWFSARTAAIKYRVSWITVRGINQKFKGNFGKFEAKNIDGMDGLVLNEKTLHMANASQLSKKS